MGGMLAKEQDDVFFSDFMFFAEIHFPVRFIYINSHSDNMDIFLLDTNNFCKIFFFIALTF